MSLFYFPDNFHKALEIMNRAVCGGQQPGAKENVSYLTNIEANNLPTQSKQSRQEVRAIIST